MPIVKRKLIKIKSVSFRANVSVDGKYNHIHIEASADVPEGRKPEDVLETLKGWIAYELRKAKEGEAQVPVVPTGRFRV